MIKSLYDALITDTLGGPYLEDPEVAAFAYALRAGIRLLLSYAERVTTYSYIDTMAEPYLDLLAAELRTPYYDAGYDITVKRSLVRQTLRWYQITGTRAAVEELGTTIFGYCKVEEWDEYPIQGYPYHFRVITQAPASADNVAAFNQILRHVKSARSYLDSVSIYRTIDTGGSHAAGAERSVSTCHSPIGMRSSPTPARHSWPGSSRAPQPWRSPRS